MTRTGRDAAAGLLLLSLAIGWGCATAPRTAPAVSVPAKEGAAPKGKASAGTGSAEARIVPGGTEPAEALDLLREAHREAPWNEAVVAEYARTVEGIKRAADRAFEIGHFARAENDYALLLRNFGDFQPFASSLAFKKSELASRLRDVRVAAAIRAARAEMDDGRYKAALEECEALLERYPGDAAAEACAKMGADIKALGDRFLAGEDFARAGRIYALLLAKTETFKRAKTPVAFTPADLEPSIAVCRTRLENRGLAAYRAGDLVRALEDWEGLLAFDPGNEEFRKAVQTVRTQIEELRKKRQRGRFYFSAARPSLPYFVNSL